MPVSVSCCQCSDSAQADLIYYYALSIRGYLSEEMSFEYIDNSSVNYNPILDICSMCWYFHLYTYVSWSKAQLHLKTLSFFVSKFI